MRLLLDEQISPAVAHRLRELDHDIRAVAEDPRIRGLRDEFLLERCVEERRVLVTHDRSTVRPLIDSRLREGEPTWGVLFLAPRFGRRGAAGALIEALDRFLRANPEIDALREREAWLG